MAESLQFKRAGAFLGGNFKRHAPDLLREHDNDSLDIKMHTDCGAVKLVHAVANASKQVDKDTYEALIPPFLRYMDSMNFNPRTATLETVGNVGRIIQEETALKWMGGSMRRVSCEMNSTLGKVEGTRILLLTVPIIEFSPTRTAAVSCMDPRCDTRDGGFHKLAESLSLNPTTTYTITMVKGDVNQMAVDPRAAVIYIGIRKVVLFAGKNDRDHVIDTFHMALRRKEIVLPGADIQRYD